jgi:hypothetical protein
MSSLRASTTATLVNASPSRTERPSIKLKIAHGKSNIINSLVLDATGQSLYSISTTSRHTTVVACKENLKVATVDWDRSSPRLVFRKKKLRCREWLPLVAPDSEYEPTPFPACVHPEFEFKCGLVRSRVFTHGDSKFIWTHSSSTCAYVSSY